MRATGIVINNNFSIIGFTLKGTSDELGYNTKEKFEKSFSCDNVKTLAANGFISNLNIDKDGHLYYTGSGNLNSLSCRDEHDVPVDNTIEITRRIVHNNDIIGFEIKTFKGKLRVPTKVVFDLASYMKCKNFVVKKVNGKEVIASKSKMKSLKELPIIDYKNKCGDSVYWRLDGTVLKISGTGDMWNNLGSVFKAINKSRVTNIIIKDNVTSIGESAFKGFKGLVKVDIKSPIKNIGNAAFKECYKLSEIELPEGLVEMGNYVFDNCKSLKEIRLPESLRKAGESPFLGCEKIEKITIGSNLYMWNFLTLGCISLKEIKISKDNKTFKSIENVVYSADNKVVLACANAKKGSVKFPNGVVIVEDYAFFDCDGITDVDTGKDVESIGVSAFMYCENLKSIKIGNNIRVIEKSAFEECKKLQSINLPDSKISINPKAFSGCSKLKFNRQDC